MLRTQQKAYAYISAGIVLFVIGLVFEELHYYASDVVVRSALRMVPHIIHLPLLVLWCVTLKRRIINKQIRKYLMSVAILMIFWLAIRTFKWHFLDNEDPLGRYIWYCYYIPMILIPLLGVFITMCIGKPEDFKLDRRFNLLYIPAIILIVFILTNDFHNLTFSFPGDITEYADELEVRKARLNMLKADYNKEFENLTILKSEVIKVIKGESSFSADTLSELIAESEKECSRLFDLCADAEKDVADGESVLKNLSDSFDELISWAELYDEASFEKKKMIVNCLIKRVEVSRGYKLKVEFNIDFEQFMVGLDKVA